MKGGRVRVVAGSAGGLWLKLPHHFHSRPTQDKVKQAVFSMLGEVVVEARVLDLFSGSGSLGIEALSRGAASCVFVEADKSYVMTIRENLTYCHLTGDVFAQKAETFLRGGARDCDLVLLDPPYDFISGDLAKSSLADALVLALPVGCWVVWEVSVKSTWSARPGLECTRQADYGDTRVLFLKRVTAA